jgi:hypothetical protein
MRPDYLLDTLEMLTGGYNRADVQNIKHSRKADTNIGKLFSLYADGLQIVHEHAEKVLLWDNLDNAAGAVLDRYGANFGVVRDGMDDDFYRLVIKVKMLSQISGGDVETVRNAASELMDVPSEKLDLTEVFPAKVWIYLDEDVLDVYHLQIINLIAAVMKRIVAAGVGFRIFLRTYHNFSNNLYIYSGASVYTRTKIGQVV